MTGLAVSVDVEELPEGGEQTPLWNEAPETPEKQLLRRFDGYLYVGQRHREYLRHYGAPADRTFFSPHCVDNEIFQRASNAKRQAEDCHTH